MERVPEPELMLDPEQARAYAEADFSEPNGRFVATLEERLAPLPAEGRALDLGCGPGDIALRLARDLPGWTIDGVDGSDAMLAIGRAAVRSARLAERVHLHHLLLPGTLPDARRYDLVCSNSLLHHLRNPATLWTTMRDAIADGGGVFVMDLLRPARPSSARQLVETYAEGEPDVLRQDFYNSLRAAYRPDEVREQLRLAGLDTLAVEQVSDRHFAVFGRIG